MLNPNEDWNLVVQRRKQGIAGLNAPNCARVTPDGLHRVKETGAQEFDNAADAEFVELVAAATAKGRWDADWLPRLIRLARRGAAPDPLVTAMDRALGDRWAWRNS